MERTGLTQTLNNGQVTITAIRDEAPNVKSFTLQMADGRTPDDYEPGQFITFILNVPGREERRSYSLISLPGEPLTITVKRVANGLFSRWLIDEARTGDVLNTTGSASGLFVLPVDMHVFNRIILFAAGIGITPLFALLKQTLLQYPHCDVVLIYSNHSKVETVFYQELILLQEQYKNRLFIEWIFSDNKYLQKARLTRSLMDILLSKYAPQPAQTLFYICGPSDYRWLVQLLLEEAGATPGNVRKEIFMTDRQQIMQTPVDTDKHEVTILQNGSSHTIQVQYPETILSAALKAGVELPYSCKAGRCSACAALCTEGEVWMGYNEVLTDKDLARGMVLTCTGYPVKTNAVISI